MLLGNKCHKSCWGQIMKKIHHYHNETKMQWVAINKLETPYDLTKLTRVKQGILHKLQ